MAEEGILIPGEQAEVENRARATGWISKEEFDADPNNQGKKWRPADEYLERGELFNTLKSLRTELGSMKKDFNLLSQHHKEMADVEYKRALATLKAQRAEAAEEGDTKTVVDISDQIDELKANREQQQLIQSQQPQVDPLYFKWVEDNPKYLSDPEFKAYADSLAHSFLTQNPGRPFAELLAYVNPKIKERYSPAMQKPAVPAVESGTNGSAVKKGSKFTKADLTDEEREVMRVFVQRKVLTEQQYIDEIAKKRGV